MRHIYVIEKLVFSCYFVVNVYFKSNIIITCSSIVAVVQGIFPLAGSVKVMVINI